MPYWSIKIEKKLTKIVTMSLNLRVMSECHWLYLEKHVQNEGSKPHTNKTKKHSLICKILLVHVDCAKNKVVQANQIVNLKRTMYIYLSRLSLSVSFSFHTTPQTTPPEWGSMVAAPPLQRDLLGSDGDLKFSL